MLRLPGRAATVPNGWTVQAKLSLYVWLGAVQNKQFSYSGLPKGFDLSSEIRNAERPGALAPSNIHYLEKHVCFCALFVYILVAVKLLFNPLAGISTSGSHLSSAIFDWIGCIGLK